MYHQKAINYTINAKIFNAKIFDQAGSAFAADLDVLIESSKTSYEDLFACLSDTERSVLLRHMTTRSYPKNATILYEQGVSNVLYLIRKGKVKITKGEESGKVVVIALLCTGDYFGEMSLIDSGPSSTDAVTVEKSQISILRQEDILPILVCNQQLAFVIMQGLTKRLREAYEKIASLALNDAYGRVVQLLMQLAKPKDGYFVIDEMFSQQDMANMVGSSRVMVSRILRELAIGGYISYDNRTLTIKKTLPAGC